MEVQDLFLHYSVEKPHGYHPIVFSLPDKVRFTMVKRTVHHGEMNFPSLLENFLTALRKISLGTWPNLGRLSNGSREPVERDSTDSREAVAEQ